MLLNIAIQAINAIKFAPTFAAKGIAADIPFTAACRTLTSSLIIGIIHAITT